MNPPINQSINQYTSIIKIKIEPILFNENVSCEEQNSEIKNLSLLCSRIWQQIYSFKPWQPPYHASSEPA